MHVPELSLHLEKSTDWLLSDRIHVRYPEEIVPFCERINERIGQEFKAGG